MRLWEASSGRSLATMQEHTGAVGYVAFYTDSQLVASGSFDGRVKLWEAKRGASLRTLRVERRYQRTDTSGLSGITAAQRASLFALGAMERLHNGTPALASTPRSDHDQALRSDK